MKRIMLTFLIACWICLFISLPALAFESDAAAVILIDGDTGKILYQENSHRSLPVASTTKVLTALLALKYGDVEKEVTVPDDFVNVGETGIGLAPGETHLLKDLLYVMLIDSANDAAQIVADAVSGSEKDFIKLMNDETAEMGLKDSSWQNPHGLNAEGHYSSAYDLAMIAKEAMQYPLFKDIVAKRLWQIPWQSQLDGNTVYNRNKFYTAYEYATGIKTGYTKQSGNCLVASASKADMNLIGVILNSSDMYNKMAELMDYGFDNFKKIEVAQEGDIFGTVMVKNGFCETVEAVLCDNTYMVFDKEVTEFDNEGKVVLTENLEAPVKKGTVLGTVTFADGEGNSVEGKLLAAADVSRYTYLEVIKDIFYRIINVLIC